MKQGAQLVYRIVDVLKGLAASNRDGIGMTELAKKTGLTGPTVHRLLAAMADVGLAYQRPEDRRYVLGALLFELGRAAGDRFDLEALCDAQIECLAHETGDTAFFLVRKGHEMLCLSRASGSFPVKTLITEIGTRRPVGVGAGGLAVLAALPQADAMAIMEANAQAYQDSGRDLDIIINEVQNARASGVVVRVMPSLGATTISMAVRDKTGYPFAAVSASTISQRMVNEHLDEVLKSMRSTVKKIEAQVSFDSRRLIDFRHVSD